MKNLKFIPIILSFLLLGAHFSRSGYYFLVIICIMLPTLLFVKKAWSARLLQMLLFLGSFEWLRTLYLFVEMRQAIGMPWIRLAIILGTVALFTALSALIFQSKSLKELYSLGMRE